MPSIEQGIVAALVGDAEIASLVGDRVRWSQAEPNEPYPYVVCRTTEETAINSLDGFSGLSKRKVVFDAVSASSHEEASRIRHRIQSLLAGPQTSIGGAPSDGCEVLRASDGITTPIEGEGMGTFRSLLELLVWVR